MSQKVQLQSRGSSLFALSYFPLIIRIIKVTGGDMNVSYGLGVTLVLDNNKD